MRCCGVRVLCERTTRKEKEDVVDKLDLTRQVYIYITTIINHPYIDVSITRNPLSRCC